MPLAVRLIAPPFPALPEYEDEEEYKEPVLMLPLAVRLIAPPFPALPELEDE